MEKKTMTIIVIIGIIAVGAYLYINGYIPQINFPFSNSSNNESIPEAENIQSQNIEINNFAFIPSELTIKKGDTVRWINIDSVVHTVTSDSGEELMSEGFANGESYSHTFETAGTYNYHCSIHASMKGKIIVE